MDEDQIAYADLILLSHQEEGAEIQLLRLNSGVQTRMNQSRRIWKSGGFWSGIPSVYPRKQQHGIFKARKWKTAVSYEPVWIRSCREPSRRTGFIRRHCPCLEMSFLLLLLSGKRNPHWRSGWERFCMLQGNMQREILEERDCKMDAGIGIPLSAWAV